jgi:DeoR/GlpR family transcriptional regulator of sugar metabolism
MMPRERLENIKQIAINDKIIYVSELSKQFMVTNETIRRDLDKLVMRGVVTRSYGGALLNYGQINENKNSRKKSKVNKHNKNYIVEKAVSFIKEGSTIVADSSSIVLEVLKGIKNRKDVTVITNSLEALQELSKSNINIISTGGDVNSKSLSMQGSIAEEAIKKYNVDIALVDCKGIEINKGILDSNETEAEIKRIMIKQAIKVVLLVEHDKFDKTSLIKLFDYEDIDYIITDKKPREEWIDLLKTYNIKIIY